MKKQHTVGYTAGSQYMCFKNKTKAGKLRTSSLTPGQSSHLPVYIGRQEGRWTTLSLGLASLHARDSVTRVHSPPTCKTGLPPQCDPKTWKEQPLPRVTTGWTAQRQETPQGCWPSCHTQGESSFRDHVKLLFNTMEESSGPAKPWLLQGCSKSHHPSTFPLINNNK